MQVKFLAFLTFVLKTLEPIIVEIGYGYHWNCIIRQICWYLNKNSRLKFAWLTVWFQNWTFFLSPLFLTISKKIRDFSININMYFKGVAREGEPMGGGGRKLIIDYET